MKTEIDFDAITVDGARLKAAREERGMSVTDMAAAVTLSREQIQHMEDGGNRLSTRQPTNSLRFGSTQQRWTFLTMRS